MAYRFLDFDIDPRRYQIRRAGQLLQVEGRVLDLVLYLLRHRHRVVPREELIRQVWSGVAVTNQVLSQALHTARRLLHDDARCPTIIQTVRGRGLRFIAPVYAQPHPGENPPFVGREREMSLLQAAMERVVERRRLTSILVMGEAGIGKSALCSRFLADLRMAGWLTVSGQCSEAGAPIVLLPWREAFRELGEKLEASDPNRMASIFTRDPQLSAILEFPAEPLARDPLHCDRYTEFFLFDRLSRFWNDAASDQPLVVLIEDIHRADEATLRYCSFLLTHSRSSPILLICTARRGELCLRTDGPALLQGFRRKRLPPIELSGLDRRSLLNLATEIGSFLTDSELEALTLRSGGNPLFWLQLHAHYALSNGPVADLPETITDVVSQQISTLSDSTKEALQVGSIVGRSFQSAVVERLCESDRERAVDALLEACALGIIEEFRGRPGEFRFVHPVVRDAVYASTPENVRRRLHADLALHLESCLAQCDLRVAAFHYFESLPVGEAVVAIDLAVRAAWQEIERVAIADAGLLLERAFEIAENEVIPDKLRCRLLLGLAEVYTRTGRRDQAIDFFRRASALALRNQWPELIFEVALRVAPGLLVIDLLRHDGLSGEMLRKAYGATSDPRLRALVAARLAMELKWSGGSRRQRDALVREARDWTAGSGSLTDRCFIKANLLGACWRAENLPERLEEANELARIACAAGSKEAEALAAIFRITCLEEVGELAAAQQELSRLGALVAQRRGVGPDVLWRIPMYESGMALARGQWSTAAEKAAEFLRLGYRVGGANVELAFGGVQAAISFFRGDLTKALAAVEEMNAIFPTFSLWATARAMLLALCGERRRAIVELDRLVPMMLESTDQPLTRIPGLVQLAQACEEVGESRHAEILRDALQPFGARHAVVGFGAIFWGPVCHSSRGLALLLGDLDLGLDLAHQALSRSMSTGAMPWVAITRQALGRALLLRGRPEERRQARDQLRKAAELARELDMREVHRRCVQDLGKLRASGDATG